MTDASGMGGEATHQFRSAEETDAEEEQRNQSANQYNV